MSELTSLKLDEVHALSMEIFNAHGLSEEQATAIVDTVTAAERDDCKSHGITNSLAQSTTPPLSLGRPFNGP